MKFTLFKIQGAPWKKKLDQNMLKNRGVPNSDFCRIRIFSRIHFAESEYSAEHSALPNNEENMFNQSSVQCRCSIKQVTLYQ